MVHFRNNNHTLRVLSRLSLLLTLAFFMGCASHQQTENVDACADEEQVEFESKDPLEGLNRTVFAFNDFIDRWLLRPTTIGYKFITPDPVEKGVSNFFGNLSELTYIANDILQWKWKQAGNDSARFTLNTIGGLGGLVDVATEAGFEKNQGEDFGQTLRTWGVSPGPYIVLPFLGPSTITDAVSIPVDWATSPVTYVENNDVNLALWGLSILNLRAGLLEADKLVTGDKYVFYREAYLQNREFLVNDGEVKDDFGGEEGCSDDFDF